MDPLRPTDDRSSARTYRLSHGAVLGVCLVLGDEGPDQTTAMGGQTVPNDRQPSAEVAVEVLQELDDLWRLDTAGKESEIEVPDRDAGNGREALPVERILQDRSLPARRPSPNPMRSFAQAALVHKDYGSALCERFSFISGQRTRFHRRMAPSSRCVARPTGRWQLQPRDRRILQTCPG